MKKIKKFMMLGASIAAVAAPVATVVSCSGSGDELKIGSTVWKADDAFMSVVKRGFDKAASTLSKNGPKVVHSWSDGQGDQAKITDAVDTAINTGAVALVVNLVDPSAASTIIKKAKAAQLPLILYNKEASPSDMASYDKVWYVGTASRESGEKQVQDIVKSITQGVLKDKNDNGILNYFIINGEANHPDAMARTEAVRQDIPKQLAEESNQTDFTDAFKKDKTLIYFKTSTDGKAVTATDVNDGAWAVDTNTHRVYVIKGKNASALEGIAKDLDDHSQDNEEVNITDWSSAKGKEVADAKITGYGDRLDFIAANNDGTALGAVQSVRAAKKIALSTKEIAKKYVGGGDTNYMPVYGVDNTPDAVASMSEGWLTGTVLNDGYTQGRLSLTMGYNAAKKGTTPTDLIYGFDVISSDFKNELNKPSKAIRVPYTMKYNPIFEDLS